MGAYAAIRDWYDSMEVDSGGSGSYQEITSDQVNMGILILVIVSIIVYRMYKKSGDKEGGWRIFSVIFWTILIWCLVTAFM